MTFCCLSRGKRPTCVPVKSNFAQCVVFEKDVSISYTEKYDLVYVFRGLVDSSETEMMQIYFSFIMTDLVKFSLWFGPGKAVSLSISFICFQCSENNGVEKVN